MAANPQNATTLPVAAPSLADPLWSKAQAASALGVSIRAVQTLRRQNKLRPTILCGKMLFRRSECERCAKAAESGTPRDDDRTDPTDAPEQAGDSAGEERFRR